MAQPVFFDKINKSELERTKILDGQILLIKDSGEMFLDNGTTRIPIVQKESTQLWQGDATILNKIYPLIKSYNQGYINSINILLFGDSNIILNSILIPKKSIRPENIYSLSSYMNSSKNCYIEFSFIDELNFKITKKVTSGYTNYGIKMIYGEN